MMINDLSVSKELDRSALSSVNGGISLIGQGSWTGGAVAVAPQGMGNVGNVTLAINVPAQINVATPVDVNLPLAIGLFGSTAVAA
jgi:hypothetical protein